MAESTRNTQKTSGAPSAVSAQVAPLVARIRSQELLKQSREVEIDHEGRIYRLRLTQFNKLILTA